jgi:D-galactarolactone cycloisomerase
MYDRPMVLVRVEDEEGATGWGEIWCNYPSCGAEHRARIVTSILGPRLLQRVVSNPESIWSSLTRETDVLAIQSGERGPISQAIAGVDIALWDLFARRSRAPLWRLLGGSDPTIGTYASGLNPHDAEGMASRAQSRGFHAFKLKVGFGGAIDHRNLRALRELLGPATSLMADANQAWDFETARNAVQTFASYDLAWIEEPLRADRPLSEWAALARLNVPLAAGENIASTEDFNAAISSGAIAVIQPDVAKWGGFSGCLPIAKAARVAGRRYCPHYLGGGLGLVASAHLLAAAGGDGMLEIDVNDNPLREILGGPVRNIEYGRVRLPDTCGLGFDPDLDALSEFIVEHHVST